MSQYIELLKSHGFKFIPLPDNKKSPPPSGWQSKGEESTPESNNVGAIIPIGYTVLDCDTDDAVQKVENMVSDLPRTLSVNTPRGRHYYWVGGEGIKQRTNNTQFGHGVDTRAGGKGYVVSAGSVVDGKHYSVAEMNDIQAMPSVIHSML